MIHSNKKTKITASAIGVLLGMGGIINHGLFEILQGNNSTNGFFIEAISEANRFWVHGTEAAFTIIHNFLITGICSILKVTVNNEFNNKLELNSSEIACWA